MTLADPPSQAWYLDAAATAPLLPGARRAMIDALDTTHGNASSVHSSGHRARALVEHARGRIAAAFHARPSEVVFTSGGTEANNLAIIGAALARPRGRHLITTAIEHPSVIEACRFLQRVHGFSLTVLPVDGYGLVDDGELAAALREDTTLVSIGLANGEVGTVQPIADIVSQLGGSATLLHTDAIQAAASLPVSLGAGGWPGTRVDALSLASHKFGGPQGVGALLVRGAVELEPLLHGGGHEGGRRSGTENVAAIAGFAAAVEEVTGRIGSRAVALSQSRNRFVAQVLEEVPGSALTGHPTERLPGHASFVVEGVSGESLLVALDTAGIAASSGSACAAGQDEPSPVLIALGVEPALAGTAIRFTLHEPLGADLAHRVVSVLASEVRRSR